jgi:type VI secretion system protein ImpA
LWWEKKLIDRWLEALPDSVAPCGPDLEYDNDFLSLTLAAQGKPESQFGPAESPNWRQVAELSAALLDRTRDLRVAITWLRAELHLQGYAALPLGLRLLNGLIENQWDHLHPLPDPDDGDPYARVNALTVLRETEGLIGDLRQTVVINDRAIGTLTVRGFEVALSLSVARQDEEVPSKEQITKMAGAALLKQPELRESCTSAVAEVKRLIALLNAKLGDELAPDLRPLYVLANGVLGSLPAAQDADEIVEGGEIGELETDGAPSAKVSTRGLSGSVTSREEALRAIEMVCEYLERAEPANPAPLFLRRGSQLINQNFLQLMKMLAPDALAGVAGLVGIDPYATEET